MMIIEDIPHRWKHSISEAFQDANYGAAIEKPMPRDWLSWTIEAVCWLLSGVILTWLFWAALRS